MTPEQEEKFKNWYYQPWDKSPTSQADGYAKCWQACLEANGIGEDVKGNPYRDKVDAPAFMPTIDWASHPWATEVRIAYCSESMRPDRIGDRIMTIKRPVPAWKPKDGEAVLFCDDDNHGRAMAGFIRNGILYARGLMCADWEKREKVKPFDASKIGKPWSEI